MLARTMFLTVLVGGPLAGTLMGMFADPQMKPPPEPAWRSARPDPVYGQPQRIVELGPQDLSPTWYVDRMPTWKRRAADTVDLRADFGQVGLGIGLLGFLDGFLSHFSPGNPS